MFQAFPALNFGLQSLPPRGAWIEIMLSMLLISFLSSRSPRGERGLKLKALAVMLTIVCRSPRGERGLKLVISILLSS